MNKKIAILSAILIVSLFRFYTALQTEFHLGGFSPLMALAFMGGWIWRDSRSVALLSFSALLITDLALNSLHGYPGFHSFMILTFVCYLIVFQIGLKVQPSSGIHQLCALIGSSVGFYLITNTFCWIGSPLYPQTAQGWVQSWTLGLPGYPPAYTFLRNALISDLLFWGILKFAFVCLPEKSLNKSDCVSV